MERVHEGPQKGLTTDLPAGSAVLSADRMPRNRLRLTRRLRCLQSRRLIGASDLVKANGSVSSDEAPATALGRDRAVSWDLKEPADAGLQRL